MNAIIFETLNQRTGDLTGNKYGYLTVLGFAGNKHPKKGRQLEWYCSCVCGKIKSISGSSLKNGDIKSCGCMRNQMSKEGATKHGFSKHPLFSRWCSMVDRCTNPTSEDWNYYGGRGIRLSVRWEKFENFIQDMGHSFVSGMEIERIDNNKGYDPTNCRWATRKEQMQNLRNSIRITHNGIQKTLSEWGDIIKIKHGTLRDRLFKLQWTVEEALTKPVRKVQRKACLSN